MPAWSPEFPDEDLWAIVAFVRRLPEITPEWCAEMRPAEDAAPEAEDEPTP